MFCVKLLFSWVSLTFPEHSHDSWCHLKELVYGKGFWLLNHSGSFCFNELECCHVRVRKGTSTNAFRSDSKWEPGQGRRSAKAITLTFISGGALNLSGNSPGNLFIFATLEHRAWWLPCEGESIIALAGWSATPYLYSPSPAAVRLLCMHCLVIQPLKRALCVCTNFLWWIAVWREKVAVFFVWLCPVHC